MQKNEQVKREKLVEQGRELVREHLARLCIVGDLEAELFPRICEQIKQRIEEEGFDPIRLPGLAWNRTRDEAALAAKPIARQHVQRWWMRQDEPDEILQRVHTKVLEDLEAAKAIRKNFEGYVYNTTRGERKGMFRQTARTRSSDPESQLANHSAPAKDSPLSMVSSAEIGEALDSCLNELGAEGRQCIEDRFERGIMPMEHARREGVNVSTVRVRLFRLVQELRECLESKGQGLQLEEPAS